MIGGDWKERCLEVVRDIDPHGVEEPACILDLTEAGEYALLFGACTRGMHIQNLSVCGRHLLPKANWDDGGFVTIINTALCRESRLNLRELRGLVLHELGHFFADHARTRFSAAYFRNNPEALPQGCELRAQVADKVQNSETDVPPWAGHGMRYLRVCYHLWYRSELGQWSIPQRSIVIPESYGLRVYWPDFDRTLRTEAESMVSCDLRRLAQTTPPDEFLALEQETMAVAEQIWAERRDRQHAASASTSASETPVAALC